MICTIYVKELIKTKKESSIFYYPQGKWKADIGDINENEWTLYFLNIKQWHKVKFRDFQYKVNNKIFVTNSFLFKINKIDSDVCTYCMEQPEKNMSSVSVVPKGQNILE